MTVVVPIGRGRTAPGAPRERVGVLLVNLGTPDTADARGLRVYLKEFLSDPRVIEKQGLVWKLALNGVILNTRPRDPGFYNEPLRARALGAHLNGIEAFPFFAAAVLLAEFRASPQHLIDELAILFLIVRAAYVLTYIGDRPTLRSILWSIGFAINTAIFILPAIRHWLP
jgi:uncharacterized MAPEG superfamily protein